MNKIAISLSALVLCTSCVHWPGIDTKPVRETVSPPKLPAMAMAKAKPVVSVSTNVVMSWTDTNVPPSSLYHLYWGNGTSGNYTNRLDVTQPTGVVKVYSGTNFFAATCVNSAGESGMSGEASYVLPFSKPGKPPH